MRRIGLFLCLAGVAALSASPAYAYRLQSRDYVAGNGAAAAGNCLTGTESAVPGVGGNCFVIQAEDQSVSITLRDLATGGQVGGRWEFDDTGHSSLGAGFFCASADSIEVPGGSATLEVDVFRQAACVNPSAAGTIAVEFDP
ncbi:MAG: hypothetical protein ACYDAY_02300 [Candidatus Dormibacteria bacterium]